MEHIGMELGLQASEAAERLGMKHRENFYVLKEALGIKPVRSVKRDRRAKTPTYFYSEREIEYLARFLRICRAVGLRNAISGGEHDRYLAHT